MGALLWCVFFAESVPVGRSHRGFNGLPTGQIIEGRPTNNTATDRKGLILSLDSKDLLQIEGDRCVGVCCSRMAEEEGQMNGLHAHKVAVATSKHGIHYVDFGPPVPTLEAGRAGEDVVWGFLGGIATVCCMLCMSP